MKRRLLLAVALVWGAQIAGAATAPAGKAYGPAAALQFELSYRGDGCKPGALHCYPGAGGIPLADCANIIPMTASLWTPAQLCADFRRRMTTVPTRDRKKGIIVMLKTERCATKIARACTITTAALEKRSTPLAGQFLIYGLLIKPRDGDNPPGHLPVETGANAWKNDAAGEYRFQQGPGATLVFLDPATGSKIATTNAADMQLLEWVFVKDQGHTPTLHRMFQEVLRKIADAQTQRGMRSKLLG